jgi:putative flippase GtrA
VPLDSLHRAAAAAASKRPVAGKYLAVSILNVVNHQILLNLANSGWGWSGGTSNLFAAVSAAIPAYLLSRRWVWEIRGAHSFRSELLPFWVIALVGLALSTSLAELADRAIGSGLAVAMASLAGYGVVWVVKFLVLDGLFAHAAAQRERASVG